MTTEDMLTIAAVGLLVAWWLWKHPAVAEAIGWVVLIGLVCLGVAHASQSHAPPRRGYSQRHHRGYGRRHYGGRDMRE
jgi:hypothetical protein